MHLILASTSPRRLALLRQVGLEPTVLGAGVDETPRPGEPPVALVRRLARAKAEAIGSPPPDTLVLAADTVIDLDGRTLGKPLDRDEGVAMLLALAGREHRVVTGLGLVRALERNGRVERDGRDDRKHRIDEGRQVAVRTLAITTRVRFGRVDPDRAARYWESGEPMGKAGGYAIQGRGAGFVASIVGSYSNVVGLPLHETVRLLAAAGLEP